MTFSKDYSGFEKTSNPKVKGFSAVNDLTGGQSDGWLCSYCLTSEAVWSHMKMTHCKTYSPKTFICCVSLLAELNLYCGL
jgi:hypothetical protein